MHSLALKEAQKHARFVARPRHQFAPLLIAIICLLGPAEAGAKSETFESYVAGNYVKGTPRAELRSRSDAIKLATRMAATLPGAFVLHGKGNSMLPIYTSGTLLVVTPVPFAQLSRGMSVVFCKDNHTVAHVLVAKTKDGWRTTGLNNRRQDYLSVNETNILGKIVAAFTPIEGQVVAMH